MEIKYLILVFSIFLWGCDINKESSSNELSLIQNKPREISIEGFHMGDSEIGEYLPPESTIEVYNIKTGKLIDLGVTYDLFFNDKKIEIENNWFPTEALPDVTDTIDVIIKLEIGGFEYLGVVPSYSFEDFVQLKFHMNFDPKTERCNKTYFGNSVMETMEITMFYDADFTDSTRTCKSTNRQVLEVGRLYAGSADLGWFEFYETQAGYYSKYNGKYHSKINDTTSVTFELADSAKLILTFSNGEEILRQEKGEWYYMPDDDNIRFNIFLPILLQQGENIVKFKNSGLKPSKDDSTLLTFFTYQVENKKIVKSNLLELKKGF